MAKENKVHNPLFHDLRCTAFSLNGFDGIIVVVAYIIERRNINAFNFCDFL